MIERIVKDYRTHSFENVEEVVEKLNFFRGLSKDGLHNLSDSDFADLKTHFEKFLNVHLAFVADTYPTKLFRITNNKNLTGGQKVKLQKITDLMGPLTGLSKLGRCNLSGESVFYSALDVQTAIWETQPGPDDYITLSEWKIKPGQKLWTHSVFHPEETNQNVESQRAFEAHLKAQETMSPIFAPVFIELMRFFAEEFMKPVKINENKNYLFSSILASNFLQSPPDENGFKIDSISYPSTKRDHKVTNIAVLNSVVLEKLDLVDATIFSVGETNYDLKNKDRPDLIKVSALKTHVKSFDFVENRIYYDLKREIEDIKKILSESGEIKPDSKIQ